MIPQPLLSCAFLSCCDRNASLQLADLGDQWHILWNSFARVTRISSAVTCIATETLHKVLLCKWSGHALTLCSHYNTIFLNPLPANFNYHSLDDYDKIINSKLIMPCEWLCLQHFWVLWRFGRLRHGWNLLNKVGNASVQTEKGCGSYAKARPLT